MKPGEANRPRAAKRLRPPRRGAYDRVLPPAHGDMHFTMATSTSAPGARDIPDLLGEALGEALAAAGLPRTSDVVWEVPRDARHGDYATNAALTLARQARRPPRKVAEAIVGPLSLHRRPSSGSRWRARASSTCSSSPAWCAAARLRDGARARAPRYGRRRRADGRALPPRVRLGQSDRPARDRQRAGGRGGRRARAHPPRAGRHVVDAQYYVNDAGNQFLALAALGGGRGSARRSARRPSCPRTATRASTSWTRARVARARTAAGARAPRSPCRRRSASSASAGTRCAEHGGGPAPRARGLRHHVRPVGRTRRPTCGTRACPSARSASSPRAATPTSRTARSGSARPRSATTRTACCGSRTAS